MYIYIDIGFLILYTFPVLILHILLGTSYVFVFLITERMTEDTILFSYHIWFDTILGLFIRLYGEAIMNFGSEQVDGRVNLDVILISLFKYMGSDLELDFDPLRKT